VTDVQQQAVRLTQYSHGAGCACKLGPSELGDVLRRLSLDDHRDHPDLVVGMGTNDDAAAWRRPDGSMILSTADFFTPILDDPRVWGRVAAVNAASDVYAMGGTPLFALNLVAWPRDLLPLELLGEVLAGGVEAATEGGWAIVGGHSIDGPEPMYGMSVVGEAHPDRLLTNAAARPGDALVLTKPLGTGLLATAVKRSEPDAIGPGGWLEATYRAAVTEMTRLNAAAAEAAQRAGAHAATDVTGFGLLGHLGEMTAASAVQAVVEVARVPLLPGAADLVAAGFVSGGTARNVAHVGPRVEGGDDVERILLADAQTSGGLLMAVPPAAAEDAARELVDSGHGAAVIGELVAGEAGRITLT
jgi:selenide,water dikinase